MGPATVLWVLLAITLGIGVTTLTVGAYRYGVATERLKWQQHDSDVAAAVEKQNAQNRHTEAAQQERVAAAEAAFKQAADDLADYRITHPVHVRVCAPAPADPTTASSGAGGGTVAATVPGGLLQPELARDFGPALDALMAQADGINSAYRVCLSTRVH